MGPTVSNHSNDALVFEPERRNGGPKLTLFSSVERTRVCWLWKRRLALGALATLEGDPGLGKSLISVDVAARYSTSRPMPFEDEPVGPPGHVVFIAHEDGLSDTILPRFIAAGGDPNRATLFEGVYEKSGLLRAPTLADLADWEEAQQRTDARLFIVDPLTAHLPAAVNSWRDEQMRAVLTPLVTLARRLGISVWCIRHYTKDRERDALYRGTGSIAITAQARSIMAVLRDPTRPDLERYTLVPVKLSGGRLAAPLTYEFVVDGGEDSEPKIRWLSQLRQTKDELFELAKRQQRSGSDSAIGGAMRALALFLTEHQGASRQEIEADMLAQGVSWRSVERARQELAGRVAVRRETDAVGVSAWHWYLDGEESA